MSAGSAHLTYSKGDAFNLEVVNFGDPYGKVALSRLALTGKIKWQGSHPIVGGAQKVLFTADGEYLVTPLHPTFTEVLNQTAAEGFDKWVMGKPQSILGKRFVPFGLAEAEVFSEFDLIYPYGDLLFWGARNVDGRAFDNGGNRPTNLQIPLIRST